MKDKLVAEGIRVYDLQRGEPFHGLNTCVWGPGELEYKVEIIDSIDTFVCISSRKAGTDDPWKVEPSAAPRTRAEAKQYIEVLEEAIMRLYEQTLKNPDS